MHPSFPLSTTRHFANYVLILLFPLEGMEADNVDGIL